MFMRLNKEVVYTYVHYVGDSVMLSNLALSVCVCVCNDGAGTVIVQKQFTELSSLYLWNAIM